MSFEDDFDHLLELEHEQIQEDQMRESVCFILH